MRILLSCLQDLKRHPLPAYRFWRTYFVEGLLEAGHEVIEVPNVDWAEGMIYPVGDALNSWRARTWERVEAFVQLETAQKPIHLFVGYFYPKQVDVASIRNLQRSGIPCVNFFCDNVREFVKPPAEYTAFALHWVPEFEALPMYRKAGLPHIHAAMPCWVTKELRNPPHAETEPATFIGSADVLRKDLLGRALQCGSNFFVRGPGWLGDGHSAKGSGQSRSIASVVSSQIRLARRHGIGVLLKKLGSRVRPLHPPSIDQSRVRDAVFDAEYFRISREAIVTIGVNRVPSANRSLHRPLVYSRLRDIEAPMLGACYLTEWTEGLEHMYELGKEIETYRTLEEFTDKLGKLCQDPVRRGVLRQGAQRRALSDLSVARSIARIGAHFGI